MLRLRLIAITGVIGAAIIAAWMWPIGLQVTVTNLGPESFSNVVLSVTGNSYDLGALEVGVPHTTFVLPLGESNMKLEITSPSQGRRQLVVDCYLENGYQGTV